MNPNAGRKRAIVGLLVALAVCFSASALGGLATSTSVDSWYLTVAKPSWTPPGWVFAPVWTALYAAMAVAAWLVWRTGRDPGPALVAFAVQLALNVLWSVLFFGLRRPDLALIDIGALIIAIVVTSLMFYRRSRLAGALMVPYLLWVSFAAALNGAIWQLNR